MNCTVFPRLLVAPLMETRRTGASLLVCVRQVSGEATLTYAMSRRLEVAPQSEQAIRKRFLSYWLE